MKYIDLTLTYKEGMRGFSSEPAKVLKDDGWNAQTLHLYSHAGTHMDAPLHFEVNSKTIDQYPVGRFFVDCWVVDLMPCGPKKLIGIEDLKEVAANIQPGEGLLFRTGWSAFVNQPEYRDGLPRISAELASWCVEKKVGLVGVEPPSVADVNNMAELAEVHTILLEGDIIIVEGLANLEEITQKKVELIALPLKINSGDGAPCRVVAIEREH
jgi:kynurenine formamidase